MRVLKQRSAMAVAAAAMAAAWIPVSAHVADAKQKIVPPAAPVVQQPATQVPRTPEQIRAERARRALELRMRLVKVAKLKAHTASYVYGASGPRSFDCSGFTMWLYKTVAHRRLSHQSSVQMRQTKRVSRRSLLPGDLLFWGPGGSQHVSMYIGRGKMIGANNPRSGIKIERMDSSYWRPRFAGAGRVITA